LIENSNKIEKNTLNLNYNRNQFLKKMYKNNNIKLKKNKNNNPTRGNHAITPSGK
jgi:hypothetical protein